MFVNNRIMNTYRVYGMRRFNLPVVAGYRTSVAAAAGSVTRSQSNRLDVLSASVSNKQQRLDHSSGLNHPAVNKTSVRTMSLCSNTEKKRLLTLDNINENIIKMEYAVRGPLVIRAGEIEKELQEGANKPFDEVIRANIGDCHAMGQPYITFIRQLLAICLDPSLLDDPKYPQDVKDRAGTILNCARGNSLGAYTDSNGLEIVRQHVAQYIEERDCHPSSPNDIYLSAGASPIIRSTLNLLNQEIDGCPTGVMVPIPQYPLYSASIVELGMTQVGYFLNEEKAWGLTVDELERSYCEAQKHCCPRAIVVINPGNPTGQVLSLDNIQSIIKFAHEKGLMILADEVYQHNIYAAGSKFHSFKRVLMDMGKPYSDMELASYMSCSKGYMGECGIRGGYCELINLDPDVRAMFNKSLSAQLCSTSVGQACVDAVVNPPRKGEPSYEQYICERTAVLDSLKQRAELIANTFNTFEGFSCNPVQGAMYAFPRIQLPQKAIDAAKKEKKTPDGFYAFKLLEETGICIVPGSGFGQMEGTYHFRTTILPQMDLLKVMLDKFNQFHKKFIAEYK